MILINSVGKSDNYTKSQQINNTGLHCHTHDNKALSTSFGV